MTRKTNPKDGKPKKNYFGKEEELAVVKFIQSDDYYERTKIYNEELRYAIEKLAESIINTYKLHRKGYSFEDIHTDTISFLMIQASKFNPEANKKAYSYYGTICKNYLMNEMQKDSKKTKRNQFYDDYSATLEEDDKLSYEIDHPEDYTNQLIKDMVLEIDSILNDDTLEGKKKLNENEVKLGYALKEILSNWEKFLDENSKSPKYDKNSILASIRNYTQLTTKDIRGALNRYKKIYELLKYDKIDDGLI
jgi:hypothetical protein